MPHSILTFEFITTFLLFLGCFAVAGTMAWLERRPKESLAPRLLPATPIMLVAGFVGLLALVHLLNLSGVQTGR
jgi:amino acid transporter